MYSFDNGELPHYFDNYFSDTASVHINIKRDLLLRKNII